jgi:hypothetical protein
MQRSLLAKVAFSLWGASIAALLLSACVATVAYATLAVTCVDGSGGAATCDVAPLETCGEGGNPGEETACHAGQADCECHTTREGCTCVDRTRLPPGPPGS